MIDWILAHPMTVFFIIAGAMVLYQVWRQIQWNRAQERRAVLDTFEDATDAEKQRFERMI